MVLLVTIAFFMAVAGCFIMLELSPFAFLDGLSGYLKPKNDSIRSKVKDSRKKKEVKGLQLLFEDVNEILRLTGKSSQFSILCVLAMILFVLGVLMALTMNNVLLVPVLAIGFALMPFYYVKFTASRHKKQINTELETALSMITTSYLRNKNNRREPALSESTSIGSVPQLFDGSKADQFQHGRSIRRTEKRNG